MAPVLQAPLIHVRTRGQMVVTARVVQLVGSVSGLCNSYLQGGCRPDEMTFQSNRRRHFLVPKTGTGR